MNNKYQFKTKKNLYNVGTFESLHREKPFIACIFKFDLSPSFLHAFTLLMYELHVCKNVLLYLNV